MRSPAPRRPLVTTAVGFVPIRMEQIASQCSSTYRVRLLKAHWGILPHYKKGETGGFADVPGEAVGKYSGLVLRRAAGCTVMPGCSAWKRSSRPDLITRWPTVTRLATVIWPWAEPSSVAMRRCRASMAASHLRRLAEQRLALSGEAIAIPPALHQRTANRPFQSAEPTLHGRLIDAEP